MNKRDFLKGVILFFPAGGVLSVLANQARAAETGAGEAGAGTKAAYDPANHY